MRLQVSEEQTLTIKLDDELSLWLAQEAKRTGLRVDEVAASLLRDSISKLPEAMPERRSVMEFAGVGAGRPGALNDKDAQEHIDELRAEWSDREQQWDR